MRYLLPGITGVSHLVLDDGADDGQEAGPVGGGAAAAVQAGDQRGRQARRQVLLAQQQAQGDQVRRLAEPS